MTAIEILSEVRYHCECMTQSGDPLLTVYKTADGRSQLGMLAFPAASAASMTCLNTNPAGQRPYPCAFNCFSFTTLALVTVVN